MKKRIVSALLALVLILSNFTGGGLIEHVHVEAAGESASVTYYFKENDAQDSSDKYNNAECTGREWGLYDLTPLIAKSVGGVLTEDVASVTLSFKVEGDISQWKSGSDKDMKPCIEVCLNDYSWAGGQQLKNIEVTQDTVEVTLDNIDPFAKSIGFSAYAFKPGEAVKFTVTVTASTKRESAAYTKALDIITNSVGVSGNKFENSFNQVVAISSEDEEWALYQKAAKVDNARFVLKYTINTTGDQTGGWANFFEGRMHLSNPYDEIHMEIPNWKPDADKFICVLDGVKQPNKDKLLADGEHIVYYKCRDYINAFNTHTCDTHSEGDISFDMSNAIAFQSGLDEGRTMTITDLYVEVPVGTDLSGDFDAYLYLDQQHGNTKQLPTHVTLYDTEYDIECTGAIGTYSIIKGVNSGEITSIPNGSIIRVSNFEVDGVKQPFKGNAEYVDFIVGTDERGNPDKEGRVAAALYFNDFGFEVFNMDDSLNREGSKTHVTFKILKPASEPEPEPVPKPVAPEGYEIVYELDLTDKNIEPNWQGISGDNAAIAAALQKDGAYVEFITCYPGATAGWIRIELEDGTQLEYNSYDSEIRSVIDKTDRTSIVRLPNEAVLDAIKQAQEKGTAIKGISLVSTGYSPDDEPKARKSKSLGLFIYAKIPGDEPDLPTCEGHDDTWTVIENPEKSEDEGTRFKIKLNEGDKIYNGDTLELHILGTADVEGKTSPGIRLYVASGEGYTSNNLTGSYDHVANITSGLFEFDAKFVIDAATGNPSNPEAVKYIGDSIVFNINDGGYNRAEITHFAYKITHHEHSPLEGTYKPVEGGDTQHSYECSICHQTITENHTPGAEYGSDETSHWKKCADCGGKVGSTAVPHDDLKYTPNSDNKTHTVECKTCGYKNESEEHVESKNKYDEDDVGRYHVCEYCNARLDKTEHHYVFVDDKNGTTHHEECETCHHKKTDSTAEHEYENGVCSKCGYAHPEAEHTWGSWIDDGDGANHSRTCSICHKTETAAHTQGEQKSDENNHWYVCSECNAEYNITKHVLEYVTDGANGHHQECTGCDYKTATVAHSSAPAEGEGYTDSGDGEHHTYKCAQCGETVTAAHNYKEGEYVKTDRFKHWQKCTLCSGISEKEDHTYEDGNEHCTVCDYWNHQHTMKWMDDGKNHWEECTNPDCDYKTEKEPHVFDGSYDYNSTQHSQTCLVCHAKISEDHDLVDKYDDDFHWQECKVCDYETRATRHTLKTGSDENGHWEYCENCEYESDPVAHTPEKELGHDADSHWSICSECGEVYGKTAHTPSDEFKHDSEGHWTVCSVCGYESTEKNEHTWDDGEITVEPTETTEGVKTYTCTECGETKTETIPKVKHTHVAGKEWKHDEKTHWHECVSETCDDKTAKLDEAAHTEDEGTVTKAATETEEGVMTYKCTVCGAVTRTESIPKVTHTHVAGKEWKYDEKTHWHECVSETCDDKTAKLDEAEHVWDDGKVTVEPTYTKEGEKLYTCEVCGETRTETVPVKGHEHSTVTKSDENGHWEECTVCGETVGEVEAHTPGEWITDSEATSTEAGKRHKECTVCGYVTDELTVPAVGDIDVEVPTVGNVPKVELPAEQQEVLKNAIIDEEDVEAIEGGASIDIELTVENAESTIAPEDKAKSDEAATQGNYTHVRYLDINLTKVVTDANGASTSEEISELGKEVRIVITVPLALAKPTGRDFAVIRVHDGEAAVLKDLDSDPNTVTISTNLFSSYTLVYVDTTPVPSTPGGLIGHVHVITGLQNDAHYHWRGCFICSMRVDYEPHRFVDGVCTVCHYRDPDYVPEVEEEEPAEAPDKEVTVVDAPAEGTEQGGDSEGTPEVTDTPADLPETEAEVVEVKEDDETSENPKTGVVFTGIGAVMAAIAALVAKRK